MVTECVGCVAERRARSARVATNIALVVGLASLALPYCVGERQGGVRGASARGRVAGFFG
jgi:hypothetical protein